MGIRKFLGLDEHGREVPDPTPIAVPAGFKRPETLAEQVKRLVRSERWSQAMEEAGNETFEESEDFEIDDDMFDPHSPYEEVFDPVLGKGITYEEFKKNEAVYRERFLKAEEKAYEQMHISDALRARPKRQSEQQPEAAKGAAADSSPAKPA